MKMDLSLFDITDLERDYLLHIGDSLKYPDWKIQAVTIYPGVIEVTYVIPTIHFKVKTSDVRKYSFTEMSGFEIQTANHQVLVSFWIQRVNVK